jgi:hypothetical protein
MFLTLAIQPAASFHKNNLALGLNCQHGLLLSLPSAKIYFINFAFPNLQPKLMTNNPTRNINGFFFAPLVPMAFVESRNLEKYRPFLSDYFD